MWLSVDPLAEKYPSWSPYAYTFNNPIRFIDPTGFEGTDIIIRGANDSSVTLKTDLIDVAVNASSLGVDFGGNYTLQGEALLSAGLDIVGIFDPTGVADGLNVGLQAKNGDWLGAGISALGVIPYVGDVAKVGKIAKDVKIIKNAINAIKNAEKAKYVVSLNKYAKIGSTGKVGEDILKFLGGESQKVYKTKLGRRVVDQVTADGIINESKVGYTSLTSTVRKQIAKDAYLMTKGRAEGAIWHFFESPKTKKIGASKPLLQELKKNNIQYIIHK